MPSNIAFPTPKDLAVRLLRVLPQKVGKIIDDITSGIQRRTSPDFMSRFTSFAGEIEKTPIAIPLLGRTIKADKTCNSCGLCVSSCPTGNIEMKNGHPSHGWQFVMCMKCLYLFPQKSLKPAIAKFIIFKQGFDLNTLDDGTPEEELASVDAAGKSAAWKAVAEYLKE
ncbi:MAG: 4Fe-4S binding protein [Clostridiales bacterium]|nr:4Fe-4S binding protein [Clostridiales bacterium]